MQMDVRQIEAFAGRVQAIQREIEKEMVGQKNVVRQLLIAIICGGNVLLEGVPGLGKTRLVKTLGKVLGLGFSRIQFTPDLMPADVTGTNIIVKDSGGNNAFAFQKGPVFSNIVLADEINRATPKTQSALLEAMQEHTVTAGAKTHALPQPFFVLATQNPMEQEGTYPLPEAQLDRFFFKLWVDYPDLDELRQIVDMTVGLRDVEAEQAADASVLLELREVAKAVPIASAVQDFALRLVLATHPESEGAPEITKQYIRYGASPRAAQALVAASRAQALLQGRFNVAFDDIASVAHAVLRHRVILNFDAMANGQSADGVIDALIERLRAAEG